MLKDDLYLDCYDQHRKGLCYASYANSPRNCFNNGTEAEAKANAKLCLLDGHLPYLKSLSKIRAGDEILWDYGDSYFLNSQGTIISTPSTTDTNETDSSYIPTQSP